MSALPKIRDRITITYRNPNGYWSSGAGGKHPAGISAPFTGTVVKISRDGAINIDGWGFDLQYIHWEIAKEPTYEIY